MHWTLRFYYSSLGQKIVMAATGVILFGFIIGHLIGNLQIFAGPEVRSGPRNLDSGLSEISIVFQAAVPKPVAPKYTTSGVRRPSEL